MAVRKPRKEAEPELAAAIPTKDFGEYRWGIVVADDEPISGMGVKR
jgi:hypothetical protein